MDLSLDLKNDFLTEAFELVDSLEKNLLSLEKDQTNEKSINEIFRVAHTIKGGAATLGYNEIKELTHLMEDVLDLVRKKKITLDHSRTNILLQCKDEIERMLLEREKDNVYISEKTKSLKKVLENIKKSAGLSIEKKSEQKVENVEPERKSQELTEIFEFIKLNNFELSTLSELVSKGENVFLVFYEFNENYEMKDVAPFQVYALLNDVANVIKIVPSLQELENIFVKKVCFIISTKKNKDEIERKTYLSEMVDKISFYSVNLDLINTFSSFLGKKEQETVGETIDKKARGEKKGEEEIQKRGLTTIRIESYKVDELLNLVGELIIAKSAFTELYDIIEKVENSFRMCLKEFLSGVLKLNLSRDNKDNEEKNLILLDSFNDLFSLFDNYRENIQKLTRISSSLQESVMSLRMVPIQMIFSRFPRLVRDMAEKMNKKVEFVIEGVETEIDKSIVDDLFDPLIHIIRNSLDHGIESPEERKALGKPETGRIVLKAYQEGDSIVIEASDDGRGVDIEMLKKKALESKIIPRELVERMSPKELVALIFLPGFSTAKKVTELSGRGVGMDVVKKKIEELGGRVNFSTAKNKGSKVTIRLPLTLAIIQALLVVVSGVHFLIPIASIQETVIIYKDELNYIDGKLIFNLRDNLIPTISLKEYFYGENFTDDKNKRIYCIISKFKDKSYGLLVDEVIGEQDVVIKPLNSKLVNSTGISAAAIIGNGNIAFIVDVDKIISSVYKTG